MFEALHMLSCSPECCSASVLGRLGAQTEGGNLRFQVTSRDVMRAEEAVAQVVQGRSVAEILNTLRVPRRSWPNPEPRSAKRLVVFYSDFEVEAVVAMAQLMHLKFELGQLASQPLAIFHADFQRKDQGTIFEKKLLLAATALGFTDLPVLLGIDSFATGDKWPNQHPMETTVARSRGETLERIVAELVAFDGDLVDLYLLAPCRGNLASIVVSIQRKMRWPLRAKWRVTMHSSEANLAGMRVWDVDALRDIMACSATPMVDVSRLRFFGRTASHKMMAGFGSFAPLCFASRVVDEDAMVAALWVILDEECNLLKVGPHNEHLFSGSKLTESETMRVREIDSILVTRGPRAYAAALHDEDAIWAKVAESNKSALIALECEVCDCPLSLQLVFLTEWSCRNHRGWLETFKFGTWFIEGAFTRVDYGFNRDPDAKSDIVATFAQLQDVDEGVIESLRLASQDYFVGFLNARSS